MVAGVVKLGKDYRGRLVKQKWNARGLAATVAQGPQTAIPARSWQLKLQFRNSKCRDCRSRCHCELYLIRQSTCASSNPMSCPFFSDSYHLCFITSSCSAWASRYSKDAFTKSCIKRGAFIILAEALIPFTPTRSTPLEIG